MRRKSTRNSQKETPEKKETEQPAPKTRRSRRRKRTPSKSSESEEDSVPIVVKKGEETPDTTTKSHTPSDDEPSQEPVWKVTSSEETAQGEIQKLKICLTRPATDSPDKGKGHRATSGGRSKTQTDDESCTPVDDKVTTRRGRTRGSSNLRNEDLTSQQEGGHDDDDGDERKGKGKSKGKHKSKIEKSPRLNEPDAETNSDISGNDAQVTQQSPTIVKAADNDDSNNEQCAVRDEGTIKTPQKSPADSEDDEPLSSIKKEQDEKTQNEVAEKSREIIKGQSDSKTAIEPVVEAQQPIEPEAKADTSIQPQLETESVESQQPDAKKDISKPEPTPDQNDHVKPLQDDVEMAKVPEVKDPQGIKEANPIESQNQSKGVIQTGDSEPQLEEVTPQVDQPIATSDDSAKVDETSVPTIEPEKEQPVEPKEGEHIDQQDPEKQEERQVVENPSEAESTEQKENAKTSDEEETVGEEISLNLTNEETLEPDENSPEEPKSQAKEVTPKKTKGNAVKVKLNREKYTSPPIEVSSSPTKLTVKWNFNPPTERPLEKVTLNDIEALFPSIEFPEFPDLKTEVAKEPRKSTSEQPKKYERIVSVESTSDTASERANDQEEEKESMNIIAFNRKISIVDDTASKLRPPPSPAKNAVSEVLFITNLVRPFTLKQLKELLERTGKIVDDGFWTDKIKSKCYAQYESAEAAEATRNALHGVQWPIGNGKNLVIDFATADDLEKAKNPPVITPTPTIPVPEIGKAVTKEVLEPLENKSTVEERTSKEERRKAEGPVREWDIGKKELQKERSRSRDRGRKNKRTPSPYDDYVTRKQRKTEETAPQKMMDDLFLKTKAVPSIYWQPLSPEEISMKQQQRLIRMEEHKRRMEEDTRTRGRGDSGRGVFRRRYD